MTFKLLDVRNYSTVIESPMPDDKFDFAILLTKEDYILDTPIPYRLDVQSYVNGYSYDWNKQLSFEVILFQCDIVLPVEELFNITCYQNELCEIGPMPELDYNNA
jgi:hypothetical protein